MHLQAVVQPTESSGSAENPNAGWLKVGGFALIVSSLIVAVMTDPQQTNFATVLLMLGIGTCIHASRGTGNYCDPQRRRTFTEQVVDDLLS